MVVRPENLSVIEISLTFNGLKIEALEIDFDHINKNDRSNDSANQIAYLVGQALHNEKLKPCDKKYYGVYFCDYYVMVKTINKKRYKIVFCQCNDRRHRIGVITLHRLRG